MDTFEDLETWKSARVLRNNISKTAKTFPVEEKYRLIDQITRSSRSITSNIAEGFGRYHYQENIQFCRQARGSLTETLDHLLCAFDEGYIKNDELEIYKREISICLRILNGYIAYLIKAKKSQ